MPYTAPSGVDSLSPVLRPLIDMTDQHNISPTLDFGAIPVVQRRNVVRTIFLTEISLGWPPGSAYDASDNGNNSIGTAWAEYYSILVSEGYKNRGPGTLLDYPGGWSAYFTRFCKPMIRNTLARACDFEVVNPQPYWQLSFTPGSASLAKIRGFDGYIGLNTEAFFPMADAYWYSTPGRQVGSYLYIFRSRLAVLLGHTPSDQELSDYFYSYVLNGLVCETVKEIKRWAPKALVLPYAWPCDVPLFPSWPTSSAGHVAQMAEIDSGKLDKLFSTLDGICPSRYLPYTIIADGSTPGSGQVTYSTMQGYNDPSDIRCKAIKARVGTKIIPWIRGVSNGGDVMSTIESQFTCDAIERCGGDHAALWASTSFLVGATDVDKINTLANSLAVMEPYFQGIARTLPPTS